MREFAVAIGGEHVVSVGSGTRGAGSSVRSDRRMRKQSRRANAPPQKRTCGKAEKSCQDYLSKMVITNFELVAKDAHLLYVQEE